MLGIRRGHRPAAGRVAYDAPRQVWRALADALYPPRCVVCREFLGAEPAPGGRGHAPRRQPGRYDVLWDGILCRRCIPGMRAVEPPLCERCGVPFPSDEGVSHECAACAGQKTLLSKSRAAVLYDASAREVVHRYKYHGRRGLARPMGIMLADAYERLLEPAASDVVVPVPLHTRRLRQRGYNQAFLLAREWARHAGGQAPEQAHDALVRIRWTRSQTGLSREERVENTRGAFVVVRPERITGKRVILVDDVYTTGATVEECARVLAKAGAKRVCALTVARVG